MKTGNCVVLYEFPGQPLETAWRACLANGDVPSHFAAPEFFHEPMLGAERRFAVLALDPAAANPRVTGVLTGLIKDGSVVSGQIGTPQICVDKTEDPRSAMREIAIGLKSVCKGTGLATVFSWFPVEALRSMGFREERTTGTAALDISAGSEKTFRKLKGRSQIRHAMSAGVEVRQATDGDLPDYYAILKGWSEKKAMPCPSFEFIQESFRLSNNRRLFVAVHEGKVIAGTPVRFYPGATAEYAWNVSLPEFQHLRPNDLLHWRIIEWACAEGMHTYYLGATHAFLLKYCDRVIPTYRYVQDRTFLKRHTLRENAMRSIYALYGRLSPGMKEKLKRLRS